MVLDACSHVKIEGVGVICVGSSPWGCQHEARQAHCHLQQGDQSSSQITTVNYLQFLRGCLRKRLNDFHEEPDSQLQARSTSLDRTNLLRTGEDLEAKYQRSGLQCTICLVQDSTKSLIAWQDNSAEHGRSTTREKGASLRESRGIHLDGTIEVEGEVSDVIGVVDRGDSPDHQRMVYHPTILDEAALCCKLLRFGKHEGIVMSSLEAEQEEQKKR